jgi:hypothetical protein
MKFRAGASVVAAGIIGAGGVGIAGVGIGLAAAPDSGVIHGCVAKSDGALRVVQSAHGCTGHETPMSFNRRGPRGPRGAQGPAGPAGRTGPAGPAGGGKMAAPATFQMYANVDAEGELGSNVDAVKVERIESGLYDVTFNAPIGSCAASVQSGEAGGTDLPEALATVARYISGSPDAWQVGLFNAATNSFESSPFMLTVTCKSG